jgi:hypothetical protein
MTRRDAAVIILSLIFAITGWLSTAPAVEVPLNKVKRVPPAGVVVPPADRAELEAGVAELGKEIDALRKPARPRSASGPAAPSTQPAVADLLPDVQIFFNAVHYALKYDEFFNANEIGKAKVLLAEGMRRAKELGEGQPSWIKGTGLVVRGYVSKIDGSVQPYGLVIPASVAADPYRKRRLDLWYHGRGETLNEINFLTEHMKSPGQFTPPDTIVLHPYGRYCNANRFAGEIDTFEALDHAKRNYAIDDNRILVRGFSMGGAACWLFATHHSGLWAAAAPGAGFSETAKFLRITDLSTVPWYQQKLWHMYDCTDYAVNLFNCPTVAYSGELDGQKQAADMMVQAAGEVGIHILHVIGPGAHHNYVQAAKGEINRRLDAIAERGRKVLPSHVKFTTWTLRYNRMNWVTIDELEHHWERATVDAQIVDANTIRVTTQNVAALTLEMPPGTCPLDMTGRVKIFINNVERVGQPVMSDRSWSSSFVPNPIPQSPQPPSGKTDVPIFDWSVMFPKKVHGLQGPIDDAFMDSFIMVSPTGKPMHPTTAQWVAKEEAHAIDAWRKQFRGEARVKDDSAITDADIASSNLVLWGDPASNSVLAKIAGKLPILWDAQGVHVGDKTYPAGTHVPVMIYPNPLNPRRYVVLNSGFTFREYDYENNARQTSKLPDWAIVDISIPATAQTPGGISAAGFFGENWELTEGKQ